MLIGCVKAVEVSTKRPGVIVTAKVENKKFQLYYLLNNSMGKP
jgi:hypothetical protein